MGRVVLDSGAILGSARRSQRAVAVLKQAAERRDDVTVPAVVIAETVRGDHLDPRLERALKAGRSVATTPRQGRVAGQLLTRVDGPSTIDALVMAAALLAGGPAMIVTSDEDDFRALLDSARSISALRSSAARVAIVSV